MADKQESGNSWFSRLASSSQQSAKDLTGKLANAIDKDALQAQVKDKLAAAGDAIHKSSEVFSAASQKTSQTLASTTEAGRHLFEKTTSASGDTIKKTLEKGAEIRQSVTDSLAQASHKTSQTLSSTAQSGKQLFDSAAAASGDVVKKTIEKGAEIGQTATQTTTKVVHGFTSKATEFANSEKAQALAQAATKHAKAAVNDAVGSAWKTFSRKAMLFGFGAVFVYGVATATPGAIAKYYATRSNQPAAGTEQTSSVRPIFANRPGTAPVQQQGGANAATRTDSAK